MDKNVKEKISSSLIRASRVLDDEVVSLIEKAREKEKIEGGKIVLSAISENIRISKETGLPLCQDTGLFWCLAEVGRNSKVKLSELENVIKCACEEAAFEGYFRKSSVTDPIYKRINTENNLPVIIYYKLKDGYGVNLKFLLKGFGSENCSSVRMLNPTQGESGVLESVFDIVQKAKGKPCPPIFIGVGVGGTMDRAALLSKEALFKKGQMNQLENKILEIVNKLNIGPGGLGGENTALSVRVLEEPTHIAGLPVAVTINCWCERRVEIEIKEEEL